MVATGTDLVETSESGGVVTLRLNRPEKLNALNPELVDGLLAGVESVGDAAILVTGAGDATCGGMDTDIVGGGDYPESHPDLDDTLGEVYDGLLAHPGPTAVAGRGALVGAGFSLSLRCDFLVLAEDTTVALPEIRYDIPVLENAGRLAELVGPRIAKQIALTGGEIDPGRLHELGLANAVVPEDPETAARELLATVTDHESDLVQAVLEAL